MNTSKKSSNLSEADNGSIKNISESTKEDRNKEATSKDISNVRNRRKGKTLSDPIMDHRDNISPVRKRLASMPIFINSKPLLDNPDNISPRRREQKKKRTPSQISPVCYHKSTQTTSQGQGEKESRENNSSSESVSLLLQEIPSHNTLGLQCPANRRKVSSKFLWIFFLSMVIIIIVLSVKLSEQKPEEKKAAACSIISEDNCPDGWIGYRRNCYYFAETEGNWTSSKMNCSSFNASLALVDFNDDMEFLSRYKTPADYWIGLQRNQETEPWKWANGTIFNNWFEVRGGGECAYLNHKGAASSFCSREIPWICTKPKERMSELGRT